MKPEISIRDEAAADASAITEVTVAAFKTLAISNHTEQFVIVALRAANALTLSLVAEADGRVVGHIAFSPVTISDGSAHCPRSTVEFHEGFKADGQRRHAADGAARRQ